MILLVELSSPTCSLIDWADFSRYFELQGRSLDCMCLDLVVVQLHARARFVIARQVDILADPDRTVVGLPPSPCFITRHRFGGGTSDSAWRVFSAWNVCGTVACVCVPARVPLPCTLADPVGRSGIPAIAPVGSFGSDGCGISHGRAPRMWLPPQIILRRSCGPLHEYLLAGQVASRTRGGGEG